jgi:hypothetical protein
LHRLTDRGVKAAKAPGYLPDGGNLYLQVSPSGSKSWLFRYQRDGKERQMGLGSINDLTLADIPWGPHLHRWFNMDFARPEVPHLRAWYDRLLQRPAYKQHLAGPVV